MKTALEILSVEHQNILKVLDAVLKECRGLESGKETDVGFFRKVIDFVRNYADKFHHAKEEDILFVELNREGVLSHCNPTQQMLYEHDLGRGFVKALEEGIEENNKEKIIKNATEYAQLLQDHIFKEDNILYPMADDALSEVVKKEMLERFEKIENDGIKEYLVFVEKL